MSYVKERSADMAVMVTNKTRSSKAMFGVGVNSKKGTVTYVWNERRNGDYDSCGIFYFKYGYDFIRYCKQMINKDIKVNGEFWVAPVINEAIQQGGKEGRRLVVPYLSGDTYIFNKPDDVRKFKHEDPKWAR